MSDSIFRDDDPSVYKSHILYIIPGDANCMRIQRLIEQSGLCDEIYHQDVRKLGSKRPRWIDGVPILAVKQTGEAHKGTNIDRYVAQWVNTDLLPAFSAVGGHAAFETGAAMGRGNALASSVFDAGVYTLTDGSEDGGAGSPSVQPSEGGTSDKGRRKKESEAEQAARLEKLIEHRNALDRQTQARFATRVPPPRQDFDT